MGLWSKVMNVCSFTNRAASEGYICHQEDNYYAPVSGPGKRGQEAHDVHPWSLWPRLWYFCPLVLIGVYVLAMLMLPQLNVTNHSNWLYH